VSPETAARALGGEGQIVRSSAGLAARSPAQSRVAPHDSSGSIPIAIYQQRLARSGASLRVDRPSYMHSFAASESLPHRGPRSRTVNPLPLRLGRKPFIEA